MLVQSKALFNLNTTPRLEYIAVKGNDVDIRQKNKKPQLSLRLGVLPVLTNREHLTYDRLEILTLPGDDKLIIKDKQFDLKTSYIQLSSLTHH